MPKTLCYFCRLELLEEQYSSEEKTFYGRKTSYRKEYIAKQIERLKKVITYNIDLRTLKGCDEIHKQKLRALKLILQQFNKERITKQRAKVTEAKIRVNQAILTYGDTYLRLGPKDKKTAIAKAYVNHQKAVLSQRKRRLKELRNEKTKLKYD